MVKCVIFDLGNVIVRNEPSRHCRELSRYCVGPVIACGGSLLVAPRRTHRLMSTGKIGSKAFYREAVRKSGQKNLPQRKFERLYADMFRANVPVQRLARKLKEKYGLLLLSDTDEIHFRHIMRKFPVMGVFSRHILSCRVGCKKPAMAIYREAIKKSGFNANECVFIDDKAKNVAGARKAGMHSIRYTTDAKLKSSLKRIGVKF